jgi:hypothetical protein
MERICEGKDEVLWYATADEDESGYDLLDDAIMKMMRTREGFTIGVTKDVAPGRVAEGWVLR